MLLEDDPLATRIGEALMARGAKVAVSQTTAGGLISARMLSVAGASRWFESAIVPYSSPTKFETLGMDREMAREHGAVSPIWVAATAEAVKRMTGVAYAVAESGIAGPQGSRRSPKPVGSVSIAATGPAGTRSEERVFPGTRVQVMEAITERAMELLLEVIEADPVPAV
ncbi:MAG: CinA family protein [Dehalococcoidia bacterium]